MAIIRFKYVPDHPDGIAVAWESGELFLLDPDQREMLDTAAEEIKTRCDGWPHHKRGTAEITANHADVSFNGDAPESFRVHREDRRATADD